MKIATHSNSYRIQTYTCTMYYTHMQRKCNGFIHSTLQQTGNKQHFAAFAKS